MIIEFALRHSVTSPSHNDQLTVAVNHELIGWLEVEVFNNLTGMDQANARFRGWMRELLAQAADRTSRVRFTATRNTSSASKA